MIKAKENKVKNTCFVIPINPMPDGTCRTIKSQYYKTSCANYIRGGSMGATGVIAKINERKDRK